MSKQSPKWGRIPHILRILLRIKGKPVAESVAERFSVAESAVATSASLPASSQLLCFKWGWSVQKQFLVLIFASVHHPYTPLPVALALRFSGRHVHVSRGVHRTLRGHVSRGADPSLPLRSAAVLRFHRAALLFPAGRDFGRRLPLVFTSCCADTYPVEQILRCRSGFRLRAPASLTPANRLKLSKIETATAAPWGSIFSRS